MSFLCVFNFSKHLAIDLLLVTEQRLSLYQTILVTNMESLLPLHVTLITTEDPAKEPSWRTSPNRLPLSIYS